MGTSATITMGYDGNTQAIIIPTALGVLPLSTTQMGGGKLTFSVEGYFEASTRLEVEAAILACMVALSTVSGTLTVEYGISNYTIASCVFTGAKVSTISSTYGKATFEFMKSAY
jgi:hypothetical protein